MFKNLKKLGLLVAFLGILPAIAMEQTYKELPQEESPEIKIDIFDVEENNIDSEKQESCMTLSPKLKKKLVTIGSTLGSGILALGLNQISPNSAPVVFSYGTFGTGWKALNRDMNPKLKLAIGAAACALGYTADYWLLPSLGITNGGLSPLGFIMFVVATKRTLKAISKSKTEDEVDAPVEEKKEKKKKIKLSQEEIEKLRAFLETQKQD